jgi:putative endopeptidase
MKKYILLGAGLVTALVLIESCKLKSDQATQKFLDPTNIDSSIKPGDDFFTYANGAWIKRTVIPATDNQAGGFYDLYKATQQKLKDMMEELGKENHKTGSIEQQVGDLYASGMDSATVEKRGYEPVKPLLAKIDGIKNAKGIMQFVAEEQTVFTQLLFTPLIGPDEKFSSMNIPIFYQGGLGLPDRDYYFKTDPANMAVVASYKTYATKLFSLTGDDNATAGAKTETLYNVEKQMASGHRTNVELRDPASNYNKMAVADLDKKMPNFGWRDVLNTMMIKADTLNIGQPGYFAKLDGLLKSIPIDQWKVYLEFHVLNNAASALSSPFVNAQFEYSGKALGGQKQLKPRSERVVADVDGSLGEALGQLYVKKYFTEDAKKRMMELVSNLATAFEARINNLDWMSDSTKAKAKDKLHAFIRKIGFPEKWKDYSKVTISKGTFFENLESASKNEYAYQVSKVGKPVDRTEWGMTPPTINAYYNPTFNEIVFPAGILQFPFFDPNADDAINYGGIGMVIGHEMTHGFDDQGAQYDKDGNMQNWWSKEDAEKFKAKGKQVVALYNSFVAVDSFHVNGELTLGENMADIGGIAIAYDAFKLTKQGKDTTKIDGLTPDQRFFLSYAQIWKSKRTDELSRLLVNVDPHSPPIWRVDAPLMNFTPFYNAFNVQQGDKMWRPENERIKIW